MAPEFSRGATSAKLRTYLALCAIGTIAGLTLGRPELVALVAPLALFVAVGFARATPVRIVLSRPTVSERVIEQQPVFVDLTIVAESDVDRLDLELRPHPWLAAADAAANPSPLSRRVSRLVARRRSRAGSSAGAAIRLEVGERREIRFELRAERWGAPPAGELTGRARDRFGLIDHELAPCRLPAVRVFPRAQTLTTIVDPQELQATTGNRIARGRGEGIEFAEVRPFAPGDVVRRINWRVTARRGALYVTDRHPEKNADVILFLDTFTEVGDARGTTLLLAVRAATSLAAAYLARRDRVGVIGFGGVLRAIGPRLGVSQLYRIVDALLASEASVSYVERDVRVVPRRLLPPKALVIAITPMIDERSIAALFDLRRRGFDLAVLDISPLPFAPPGPSPSDRLAHRLWRLRRDALKAQFERLGVPVEAWQESQPLQLPVATASAFRRRGQHRVTI